MGFPPIPPEIKSIAHILKVADEHDSRNIVVSYWARMHACQLSMKLIPGKKPPEVSKLLIALMDWLEETKKANPRVDGIFNEAIANLEIEYIALQLFMYADGQDRQEIFNKNMIKAFYTAGILMDILEQFGEIPEDLIIKRKYAKWKAAYIHNCLKTGENPTAGGPDEHLNNVIDTTKTANDDEDDDDDDGGGGGENADDQPGRNPPDQPPPPTNNPYNPAPASSPVTPVVAPIQPPTFTPEPASPVPINPSVPLLPAAPGALPNLDPEKIQKAQKFCKYATSALNYDDVKTAIENLHKALNLLQLGTEI